MKIGQLHENGLLQTSPRYRILLTCDMSCISSCSSSNTAQNHRQRDLILHTPNPFLPSNQFPDGCDVGGGYNSKENSRSQPPCFFKSSPHPPSKSPNPKPPSLARISNIESMQSNLHMKKVRDFVLCRNSRCFLSSRRQMSCVCVWRSHSIQLRSQSQVAPRAPISRITPKKSNSPSNTNCMADSSLANPTAQSSGL